MNTEKLIEMLNNLHDAVKFNVASITVLTQTLKVLNERVTNLETEIKKLKNENNSLRS